MDTKLVNKSQVKGTPQIPGLTGSFVAALSTRVEGFDKINELYSQLSEYKGVDFVDKLLEHLNVSISLLPRSIENIPKEGKLLIVANHPFGGLDGMLALKILSSVRNDVKILTNLFVAQIPNIKDNFISVNTTYGFGRIITNSSTGIKQAEEHLEKGGALIVFPAGEISSVTQDFRRVDDEDWQGMFARIARRHQSNVLPLYFEGDNAWFLNFLHDIRVKLNDLKLPESSSGKTSTEIKVNIGKQILWSEISNIKEDKVLAHYLKNRTSVLGLDFHASSPQVPNAQPIMSPVDTNILLKELEDNIESKLFKVGPYSAYIFDYEQIPNIIKEVGVRREEAFRAVGEGTGKEIDLDEFDIYYKHLILWDEECQDLVGAYRLGMGRDIVEKFGVKGFYSNSFFRFSDKFAPLLKECVELGRSFISLKHQKDTMGLLLLLKGLFYAMMKYQEYKHFIGPVSISSWYPLFYRSAMVHYLKRSASVKELKKMVNPINPFIEDFGGIDIETLMIPCTDNLEGFDRYLHKISGGKYRFPTLVKKYLKLGSRVIDYNVDHDFNDCLDCLIILTLSDVPTDDIDSLCREFDDHGPIYKRFYGNKL